MKRSELKKIIKSMLVEESQVGLKDKLSDDTLEFLAYLSHDKGHAMSNDSLVPEMAEVFKHITNEKQTTKLYRGLYSENLEDFEVGKPYTFKRYQSFSEYESVAKEFSRQGIVLQLDGHQGGFNYWEFEVDILKELDKADPDEYYSVDGDYVIESYENEKEWIFNIDATFVPTEIKEQGEFTYIIGDIK
jgi:hypothetical protein